MGPQKVGTPICALPFTPTSPRPIPPLCYRMRYHSMGPQKVGTPMCRKSWRLCVDVLLRRAIMPVGVRPLANSSLCLSVC
eukprot:7955628-Pyramimonas_sp.AAC.2